jgi:hypothetical protein
MEESGANFVCFCFGTGGGKVFVGEERERIDLADMGRTLRSSGQGGAARAQDYAKF